MKKYIIPLCFFVIILLGSNIANQAEAQGPPINTETAFVTGLESGAVRSFGKATRQIGSLPGGRGELNIISIPLIVPYELLPNKLVVGASMPYLDKEKKTTINGERKSFSDSGFGDAFWKVSVLAERCPLANNKDICIRKGQASYRRRR